LEAIAMKYRQEWLGKLRIEDQSRVFWCDLPVGWVSKISRPGARSPGGMVTDTVWRSYRLGEKPNGQEYASLELAVAAILSPEGKPFKVMDRYFSTLGEATAAAGEHFNRTGIVVAVEKVL
jgi:hypothetical protein